MQELSPKLFDGWNEEKKYLQQNNTLPELYFCEGDIWWCSLGQNIGIECYGKGAKFSRPILILKKLSKDTCIALPLTTQKKFGSWFTDITFDGETRYILLYQIRMIHKKRFQRKISQIDEENMARVKEKLEALLELSLKSSPRHKAGDRRVDSQESTPKVKAL